MTVSSTGGGGLAANSLYYGDCLDWMRDWNAEAVDLIYLDPPFNSKSDYNVLYGNGTNGAEAQYRAFTDTWTWDDAAADRLSTYLGAIGRPAHNAIIGLYRMLGECGMLAYLTYMAERLEECHRLLKPSGTLYLHCDPTASHYLKAVLDAVFVGKDKFRNEIIWSYRRWPAKSSNFQRMHDVIFRYARGSEVTWNQLYEPLAESTVATWGSKQQVADFSTGRRKPSQTDEESPGAPMRDVWDIGIIAPIARERLGYPTQKPLKLLRRIIEASSNPGDLVLDPFCGCGTTIDAARSLNRRWAGIDISSFAVDVMLERLGDRTIPVHGIPYDLRAARRLARDDPFAFETWAINRLAGFVPNTRQVADGGIDGRATLAIKPDDWDSTLALAQVKGGKHTASGLRDFCGVTDRAKAAVGCYITLTPVNTDAARTDAVGLGKITVSGEPYRRMNLWSIADYFDDRRPHLPPMNNPYTGKPIPQPALF